MGLPADFVNPLQPFIERYGNNWPLLVREVLNAEPDEFQERILLAVQRGERRISVVSGHGVGKTTTLAWCCVCMVLTRFPQKTVCTAPTSGQLFNALYAETVKWLNKLPTAILDLIEVQSERIMHKAAPEESYIAFETSRPEKPEALAGVHSDGFVLLIGDEASGIPELIFEAASGSMSGHNATTLLAGNPVRSSGTFYDSHHKLRSSWLTIKISCVGHPRVSPDFVEDMAQRYGRDSNPFRVRVLGEFPESDDDTIIPRALAEAAIYRIVEMIRSGANVWGLDCARGGGDLSALCKRRGNIVPKKIETRDYDDTMRVTGWVKNEWDNTPEAERPEAVVVDSIGIGAGVADRLEELKLPVIAVNVSESPSFKNAKTYKNLRAELWWRGLEWLEKRNCALRDPECIEELVKVRKDYASDGRLLAESKKAMKKRGEKSPNRADAFLLTLLDDAAIAGLTSGSFKRSDWKKPLSRKLKGL
ncbi:MAG TPA: terminase family protein [Vicinamibacterales bacterium]